MKKPKRIAAQIVIALSLVVALGACAKPELELEIDKIKVARVDGNPPEAEVFILYSVRNTGSKDFRVDRNPEDSGSADPTRYLVVFDGILMLQNDVEEGRLFRVESYLRNAATNPTSPSALSPGATWQGSTDLVESMPESEHTTGHLTEHDGGVVSTQSIKPFHTLRLVGRVVYNRGGSCQDLAITVYDRFIDVEGDEYTLDESQNDTVPWGWNMIEQKSTFNSGQEESGPCNQHRASPE